VICSSGRPTWLDTDENGNVTFHAPAPTATSPAGASRRFHEPTVNSRSSSLLYTGCRLRIGMLEHAEQAEQVLLGEVEDAFDRRRKIGEIEEDRRGDVERRRPRIRGGLGHRDPTDPAGIGHVGDDVDRRVGAQIQRRPDRLRADRDALILEGRGRGRRGVVTTAHRAAGRVDAEQLRAAGQPHDHHERDYPSHHGGS